MSSRKGPVEGGEPLFEVWTLLGSIQDRALSRRSTVGSCTLNSFRLWLAPLQLQLFDDLLCYRVDSLLFEFVFLTCAKLCELLSVEAIPKSNVMVVNLHFDVRFGYLEALWLRYKIFDFRA